MHTRKQIQWRAECMRKPQAINYHLVICMAHTNVQPNEGGNAAPHLALR